MTRILFLRVRGSRSVLIFAFRHGRVCERRAQPVQVNMTEGCSQLEQKGEKPKPCRYCSPRSPPFHQHAVGVAPFLEYLTTPCVVSTSCPRYLQYNRRRGQAVQHACRAVEHSDRASGTVVSRNLSILSGSVYGCLVAVHLTASTRRRLVYHSQDCRCLHQRGRHGRCASAGPSCQRHLSSQRDFLIEGTDLPAFGRDKFG
jgi:hypothetical protein